MEGKLTPDCQFSNICGDGGQGGLRKNKLQIIQIPDSRTNHSSLSLCDQHKTSLYHWENRLCQEKVPKQ